MGKLKKNLFGMDICLSLLAFLGHVLAKDGMKLFLRKGSNGLVIHVHADV